MNQETEVKIQINMKHDNSENTIGLELDADCGIARCT